MRLFKNNKNYNAPLIDKERKKELHLFEQQASLRFRSIELLNLAFTHRSYANEVPEDIDNNEKLEFLGDSVLGLVVSEYLYKTLVHKTEGDFAKIKSFVVSEDILYILSKRIRVDNFILIGKGEEYSGGRSKKALLADAFEAIIGAYYLDSGYNSVRTFILKYLKPEIIKVVEDRHKKDYKTLLQEFVQKKYKTYPKYTVIQKKGPDHDKTFWINVIVKNKTYGPGIGKNKKEAEQKAASIAYKMLIS